MEGQILKSNFISMEGQILIHYINFFVIYAFLYSEFFFFSFFMEYILNITPTSDT